MKQKEKIYDIFISYRRNGGFETARLIYDRLTNLGYRVSFDLETLRSGKFNTQLYERIEQCKDVLVLLS
ncbi:MAG: toll/interleukin-1 receptor domain-containing protein, partial [Lentisphaeria bacterium]|nr:toll/interleukin-1 receptor domain-containing protein [Lentisphaeria bacterium]